ncbi:MAG: hypothetical protein PIR53_00685 [Nocardioides alkalitolerans]
MNHSPSEQLVITRARHVGADFSGVDASFFSAQESTFTTCSFDGATLRSAAFGAGRGPTVYVNCTFDGARIEGAAISIARFENCSFRRVELRHFFCHAARSDFTELVRAITGSSPIRRPGPDDESDR